jgi:hypothetical protein
MAFTDLTRTHVRQQDAAAKLASLTVPPATEIAKKLGANIARSDFGDAFMAWLEGPGCDYIRTAFMQWLAQRIMLANEAADMVKTEIINTIVTDAPETVRAALVNADAKAVAELEEGGLERLKP